MNKNNEVAKNKKTLDLLFQKISLIF